MKLYLFGLSVSYILQTSLFYTSGIFTCYPNVLHVRGCRFIWEQAISYDDTVSVTGVVIVYN